MLRAQKLPFARLTDFCIGWDEMTGVVVVVVVGTYPFKLDLCLPPIREVSSLPSMWRHCVESSRKYFETNCRFH
uniref:CLUMA_CG021136, isoform A n=1 Tax=Clunio marinus TaxID=568069 RepID=A0A1J1J6J4_9DIPT|nr:CLUMA_CG021136, isoform A [Clunio marinus]